MIQVSRILLGLWCFGALCASAAEPRPEPLVFNRDVRPILNDACLTCHGPDSAARQADLRLDQREAAIEHGAIAPGDLEGSSLIERITTADPDLRMPPPITKKKLKPAQIEILKRWIAEGAEYQAHWSLIAPQRPAVPEVKNSWWVKNPLDSFIAARLEQEGLSPAPEADRRTLLRRVTLDLTGVAPTPAEIHAFVSDHRPDAYERVVDRLLASPRWGEHRGRYWLDVARYADSHGIHFDNYREMWPYREWVIKAFNRNLPFDKFTTLNLAGDLVPNATLEDQVASGFNRCNITTNEGGAINEEYLVLYTRDRTETTSVAWMGLTAGCAVCHDHKFDPLSQKEFYELSAFFNNTTQAAMDGNVKDTPPIVFVPTVEDREFWEAAPGKLDKLDQEMTAVRTELASQPSPEFTAWSAQVTPAEISASKDMAPPVFHAGLKEGVAQVAATLNGAKVEYTAPPTVEWRPGPFGESSAYLTQGNLLAEKGVANFTGDEPFSCAVWVNIPATDAGYSILARLDDTKDHRGWDLWVENRRIGGHLIHRWSDNAIKVISRAQLPANEWVQVVLTYDGTRRATGYHLYLNGAEEPLDILADQLTSTTETKQPFRVGQRTQGGIASGVGLFDVRIYNRELSISEAASINRPGLLEAAGKPPGERNDQEQEALRMWWLEHFHSGYQQASAARGELQQQMQEARRRGGVSHVMHENEAPAMAHILNRGEYDQRLSEVKPSTPALLPPMAADLPRNRLGFAQWLLSNEHPLTARVTVNRFWQEVFGVGLVKTAGDFGVTGETPSHPELLDYLALDFRDHGWDVKRFFRQVVTSATYRQQALSTPQKRERDPDNRLLSRGPRFRMDGEMLRDHALAASGLLVERIGGPSVKPYQPPGVWEAVAMIGSNTRDYRQDTGEALYRRSLYTFWKRSAPPASLDIYNAPNRESCVMVRERTNTPMQALVTLNDPQFVEASRKLAETVCAEAASPEERMQAIAERLISRPLTPEEMQVLAPSVDRIAAHYQAQPAEAEKLLKVGESKVGTTIPAPELATWTLIVGELLNLDENINK